jgi:D-alanine-D-alanine ligase-like ATP-grasp enzyme
MTSLPPLEVIPTPARTVFIAGSSMGKTKRDFFPLLNDVDLDNINKAAVRAHKTLNLQYMSRVDIRMIDNIPYVLDVNTMPNLHPTQSMFPALLRMHKIGMPNFIGRLIKYHESNSNVESSNNLLHSEILMDVFA